MTENEKVEQSAEVQEQPSEQTAPEKPSVFTRENMDKVTEIATQREEVRLVMQSLGMVTQVYGWMTEVLKSFMLSEDLTNVAMAMIREGVAPRGQFRPFDDKKLVYGLRHLLLPLLEGQCLVNDKMRQELAEEYTDSRNEFLSKPAPIPFETTRAAMNTDHTTPVIFVGEEGNVRQALAYASEAMREDGNTVVFISGSKVSDFEITDEKFPVIKYANSAHFVRNGSLFTHISKSVCVGADVVVIEDLNGALCRDNEQVLTPIAFHDHYKKITRWAKEGKVFVLCGMTEENYKKFFEDHKPSDKCRFTKVDVKADGVFLEVGSDKVVHETVSEDAAG